MNDDLERMLGDKHAQGSGPNPRLRAVPRVRGGLPLSGGPKLDIDNDKPREQQVQEPAHGLGGPHVSLSWTPSSVSEPGPMVTPVVESTPKPQSPPRDDTATGYQLEARNLKKSYRKEAVEIPVLKGASLGIHRGEFLTIIGQSGSGKSTLLHLLGVLDSPDEGELYFHQGRIDNLTGRGRDALRNRHLGMIFQFYHLLPELNTLENVLAPLMIAESAWEFFRHRRKHRRTATELLELVGLGHRLKHKPRELSGGEMQRAAIARALVSSPELLLADEPTGNLDHETGREILAILRRLNREQNLTIVMVTHDQAIAQQGDRSVRLADGRVEDA